MSCSRSDHKMIEYLNPLQLFRESMKTDYYNPVFLAFSFTDLCASVAISKDYLCQTSPHSQFPIDKTLTDKLVDVIHSVKNDTVEKYELLGIVVAYNNPVENIHNLMDNISKTGNFESLKYTCWKGDITSANSAWDRSPSGSLFWRRITFPGDYSKLHKRLDILPAKTMLQMFLDFFGALYMDEFYMDEFVETEDGDEEREDKDLEMDDSESKMIKMINLKPSQFIRETMESNYYMPVLPVFLGLSFNDKFVTVAISDRSLNARINCFYWRDEILWDSLVAVVKSFYNDPVGKYELLGLIVDNNNSVDIHNLMDDLCLKGNFKSLKYTCWKDDIGSKHSTWNTNVYSAQHMLQRFLDFFKALYIYKDEEIEDKDEVIEDKDEKSEDSERKKQCKILLGAP